MMTEFKLWNEAYYTPQAAHRAVSAPTGVKVSLTTDCLKNGSILVANHHPVTMKETERARASSPRLALRTKNSWGIAALISFKDLSSG